MFASFEELAQHAYGRDVVPTEVRALRKTQVLIKEILFARGFGFAYMPGDRSFIRATRFGSDSLSSWHKDDQLKTGRAVAKHVERTRLCVGSIDAIVVTEKTKPLIDDFKAMNPRLVQAASALGFDVLPRAAKAG